MLSIRQARPAAVVGALSCLALLATSCSGGGVSASSATSGVTINVSLAIPSPPKASLDAFTKSTGITVKWTDIDWDSLQTKIAAGSTAKTYFADATDVDWSRVGQLGKLNWFYPMERYVDTKSLAADMPQLSSFTIGGHVVGIPFDASFLVTTVNKKMFAKAGVTTMPKTIDQYTQDLKQIKTKGVVQYPLNIPFAAAEGLSTYWYQTTGAFGGTILDGQGRPQFTSPDSPGYKAAQWMVDAFKQGLVPPGNINVTDSQGQQKLMAHGQVASVFGDYSGNVGSLYEVPSSSTVVKQVDYLRTPGVTGPGPNLSNPDGIGIPRTAKHPQAAAKFIQWFTEGANQADFAGLNGPDKALPSYNFPSRLSVVDQLAAKGKLIGGSSLGAMLKSSARPVFPAGAPTWYPQFSNAVYTNLHSAATGSLTVDAAIKAIAGAANRLANGG
ncbi:extracellular solute-binding protein [Actinoallomurus sp. NBC_01490]|uniref:ABC transporter substrate-binding protein n=1 Tax=Actinoallomurus sp. NBC_01490 TaxID=2903557 RepID=UPI002E37CDAA|nr:extracellular solute-binding protein [Actinoallomurus sp. NBC_01490]